jgi:hypothetical protein
MSLFIYGPFYAGKWVLRLSTYTRRITCIQFYDCVEGCKSHQSRQPIGEAHRVLAGGGGEEQCSKEGGVCIESSWKLEFHALSV